MDEDELRVVISSWMTRWADREEMAEPLRLTLPAMTDAVVSRIVKDNPQLFLIRLLDGAAGDLPPDAGIRELVTGVTRPDPAGPTIGQVLAVVLIWVLLLGEPIAQLRLAPAVQEVLNSEVGTVALALALTAIILSRKGKG